MHCNFLRRPSSTLLATVLLAIILMFVGLFISAPKASAAPATGYFTGGAYDTSNQGHHLISPSYGPVHLNNVNDAETFISRINGCLNGGACASYSGPNAAAYIVLTMMGDGTHSVARARVIQGSWEARVRDYAAAGRINFNLTANYTKNTMMEASSTLDILQYSSNITVNSIRFTNPNGSSYSIKKDCANPVGDLNPLQNLIPPTQVSGGIYNANQQNQVLNGTVTIDVTSFASYFGGYGTQLGAGLHSISASVPGWTIVSSTLGNGNGGQFNIPNGANWTINFYAIPNQSQVQGFVTVNSCTGPGLPSGATVSAGGIATATIDPYIIKNVTSGNQTMSISGLTGDYDVIGYCWENGGLTGGSSFVRNLNPGQTYNMRWVVRAKPADLNGYIVRQGDGAPLSGVVGIDGVACEGTNNAVDANCNGFPGGSHDAFGAFFFSGIPAANQVVRVQNVEAGYNIVGSKICINGGRTQAGVPACDTTWNNANTVASGAGYAAGSSRTFNFLPGTTYSMRWLLVIAAPTCGGYTSNPTILDAATAPFTITGAAVFASPAAAYYVYAKTTADAAKYRIYFVDGGGAIVAGGVPAGGVSQGAGGVSAALNGARIEFSYTFTSAVVPGAYTLRYNMDNLSVGMVGIGGVSGGNCSPAIVFDYKPVVAIRNGDIELGAGFETTSGSCSPNVNAGISAWYNNVPGAPYGSYNNYGAFALDVIHSFGTNNYASDKQGTGLTFANTSPSGEIYGGKFGGYQSCVKDYYGAKPTGLPTAGALATTGITSAMDGSYDMGATDVINGGQIGAGKHIVIYKKGNIHIKSNIAFASANYSSSSDIPSLYIIATGDITIDPAVSSVQAVLVAQGTEVANAGTIYSCADSLTTYGDDTVALTSKKPIRSYARCGANTLVIKGSLIAKRFSLTRSYGTLSQTDRAAEVILYSPLTWIAPTPLNQPGSITINPGVPTSSLRYDSITSLPPVL